MAYLAKKHGICISHEATCPIPKQQNWQTQNYGTLETTQLVVSSALEIQAKNHQEKHNGSESFGGKRLLEPPTRQCLHSTLCDETHLGCFMAVPQNEPKKT